MSTKIDERVVEMRFDNQQFESGVKTSLSTIDKLKESLNFTGASKGLENIGAAAKNVNMAPLSSAVETVHTKFSALEVMAMTALSHITNEAINAGKNLVNAFAIEPITTGFQEYELKMGSVQTIMNATGESLETVNRYLDELNRYSDQTIYSFSDMTENIAKFTNAGVSLEDSVMAIKGISNEAALAGASAEKASHAMYNFAQALSAGYVGLTDWKSIEVADMSIESFRKHLLETAATIGTVEKTADGMYQVLTENNNGQTMDGVIDATTQFNTSLQYQWMTTEVLVQALRDYSDETTDVGKQAYAAAQDVKTFSMMMDTLKEAIQSGWAQTWEIIIGDFEEGKTLWTEMANFFSDLISESADARNSLLSGAMDSNWEKFLARINEAGIATDDFTAKLKEVASGHGLNLDNLIEKYGSLAEVIAKGKVSSDLIREALDKFTVSTETATEGYSDLSEVVAQVARGDFGNEEDRIEALTAAGYDYATVQDLVNKTYAELGGTWGTYEEVCEAATKVIGEQAETMSNMSDEQLKSMGYTEDQIKEFRALAEEAKKSGSSLSELIDNISKPGGRALLIESVMNILNGIVKAISTVKAAWSDIFPPMTSNGITDLIERFHGLTEKLILNEEQTEQLKTAFKGLFGVLDMLSSIVTGALTRGFDFLSGLWEKSGIDILEIASSAGEAALKFRDWFNQNEILSKGLDTLFGWLEKGTSILGGWINKFRELPIVQDTITTIQEEFGKFLDDPTAYFNNCSAALKGYVEEFKNLPVIQQIISGVKQAWSDFVSFLTTNFSGVTGWIDGIIDGFESLGDLTLDDVTQGIKNFWESIKEFFGGGSEEVITPINEVGEAVDSFGSKISTVEDKLKQAGEGVDAPIKEITGKFTSFKDRISAVIESFKTNMPKINWGAVLSIGAGVGLLALANKAVNTVNNILGVFTRPVEAFTNLLNSVTGVFGSVKQAVTDVSGGLVKVLKSYSNDIKANTLIKVALAIGILAGSIALLAQLDTGSLLISAGVLVGLAGGLMALSKVFSKMGDFGKLGLSFTGIAAAILILVGAMKLIQTMDFSTIPETIGMLAVAVTSLLGVAVILSKAAPNLSSGSLCLIAIAVAIRILAGALVEIGSSDLKFSETTIEALMVAVGGLAAVAAACKGVKMGSAATLLAVPIAIKMFLDTLNEIAEFDISKINDNMDKIAEVLVMFGVVLGASNVAGDNAAKVGIMFLGIAASLLLITASMDKIATMDPLGIDRATETITKLFGMFAILTAASGLSGGNAAKAGVMLLAVSASLLIMTGVIAILKNMDSEGLDQALSVITMLSLVFAGLIAVSGLAGSNVGTIVALTVFVGVLSLALIAIASLTDSGNLMAASLALTLVMGCFTALLGVLGYISKVAPITKQAMVALGVVTLVTGLLAGVLFALSALEVQSSLANAAALSVLLLAMSGACLILSEVGKTGKAAIKGAIDFVAVIGVIGGLMVALGALLELNPDVEKFLNEGIPILEKVGYGIGSFIANFVTGLSMGSLPAAGKALSGFMNNLKPFLTIASGIESDTAKGIESLGDAILSITKSDLINTITSKIGGNNSLESFGSTLTTFGNALATFSESAGNIKTENITKAADAGRALADLQAAIPNSGGLLAKLVGDNTWSSISTGLEDFGTALVNYSGTVSGVDDTVAANISRSASAAAALADLQKSLPKAGGKLQKWFGESSWSTISSGLVEFGEALSSYSESVAGITAESATNITNSATAAGALADLKGSLEKVGGLVDYITGETISWGEFSDGLVEFGNALSSYSSKVSGMGEDGGIKNIKKSVKAAKALVELKDSLGTDDSGILHYFTGKKETFESFGKDIGAFAEAFVTFSDKLAGVKIKRTSTITDIVTQLATIQNAVTGGGGTESAGSYLRSFGGALKTFGDKISDYYSDIESIDIGQLSSVTAQIQSLFNVVAEMSGLDTSGVDSFADAVGKIMESLATSFSRNADGVGDQMTEAAETMMSSFIDGALSYLGHNAKDFTSAGEQLTTNLVNGAKSGGSDFSAAYTYITGLAIIAIINTYRSFYSQGVALTGQLSQGAKSGASVLTGAFGYLASSAASTIQGYYHNFYSAGLYLATGFANGIHDNAFKAQIEARAMANAAADAANNALDSHSPSRVFYKIGAFAGMGFVNALHDYSENSLKAGKEIGNSARKGISSAVAMISSTVADEMDMEPVIRPVLDLSDVKSHAGTMNQMLNLSPAVGVASNVRAISASMNNRQNGTGTDLISAIERLSLSSGSSVGGNTYIVNGVTYDDGSNIAGAVRDLVRAARIERRA